MASHLMLGIFFLMKILLKGLVIADDGAKSLLTKLLEKLVQDKILVKVNTNRQMKEVILLIVRVVGLQQNLRFLGLYFMTRKSTQGDAGYY